MLYGRQEFENYAQKFIGRRRHAHRAGSRPAASRSKPNFVVDDAMVADFREQLKTDKRQDRRRRRSRRISSSSRR